MGCHFLIQGIIPTQGSKPCLLSLLHWEAGSLPLVHLGSPISSLYEDVKETKRRRQMQPSAHSHPGERSTHVQEFCNAHSDRGLRSHDRGVLIRELSGGGAVEAPGRVSQVGWGICEGGCTCTQASWGESTLKPLENGAAGELRGSEVVQRWSWPRRSRFCPVI